MRLGSKPPLILLTGGLLALLVLLASLQYVWLGRISEAERERLQSTLSVRAAEFAHDFDRELARAYLLFQTEPTSHDVDPSGRFAERYDRWLATSSYPRLLKEFYLAERTTPGAFRLQRFDPVARALRDADWPSLMADWRVRLNDEIQRREGESALFIRRLPPPIWESVPALIVPAPMFVVREAPRVRAFDPPEFSYTVLTLDLEYIKRDLLPDLVQRHFRKAGDTSAYQVAVVDTGHPERVIYSSTGSISTAGDHAPDLSATLFQVRTQDFSAIAAEAKRFARFTGTTRVERIDERGETRRGRLTVHPPTQMSIVVQQGSAAASKDGRYTVGDRSMPPARWRVTVKHPAGSLEAFVGSTRRRNLLISTSILGVLGASMALLIASTRRSQELARQQLEFVAAVSHELRTPLAVIRSAGENLADGVVDDEEQIKTYGQLIRGEGRRLSEMVEQILEFAGVQSGQRSLTLRAVDVRRLVDEVLAASKALIDDARIRVELDIPDDLPPVRADEPALRRVLQNLIGNAIKYGASGGWMGIKARRADSHVTITVSDRGIGIPLPEQTRIFEPFYRSSGAVAARIQGAGLGLSLVKRIVEGHGGQITVRSAPDQGSDFAFSMPAANGEVEEPIPASQRSTEPAQSS